MAILSTAIPGNATSVWSPSHIESLVPSRFIAKATNPAIHL